MDTLLVAGMLPRLADLAIRRAIAAALVSGRRPVLRDVVEDALARFERSLQTKTRGGARPAWIFAQRDRIVCALRAFLASRIASRLFALRRCDLVAAGSAASPFDAIARGRDGALYAVVARSVPRDGRRLELYRRIRAACRSRERRIAAVVVYDLGSGRSRTLRVTEREMLAA